MSRGRPSLVPDLVVRFRTFLAQGEHPIGSALPGEHQLAADLGVSRPTLRQALAILEENGLVERRAGRGTYVSDPARPARDDRIRLIGFDAKLQAVSDDYYRRFLAGVQAGLGDVRHRLVMLEPEEIRAGATGVDALVIMALGSDDESALARIAAGGRPVLCFNRRPTASDLAFLSVDYRAEANAGTRALIAAGHTCLAYIGKMRGAKADRHAGFLAAARAAGAQTHQLNKFDTLPAFSHALHALIAEQGCSALFAEDAATAERICTALSAGTPRIGDGVELLCFDRCERIAKEFAVPISEIRIPEQSMGERGGYWLRARLCGEVAAPPRELHAAELLFRSSRIFAPMESR